MKIYSSIFTFSKLEKVSKGAEIRKRYNQVPHLTQDTVIPVAITAIYLLKQGVSDLGYTQAHVSFRL